MKGEYKIGLIIISIISGILNFIFLGFSIGLSSGDHLLSNSEIIGYISFFSSLIHIFISSWLFILLNKIGRIVAILSSFISSLAPILILYKGFSLLWLLIIICFILTAIIHMITLNKQKNKRL